MSDEKKHKLGEASWFPLIISTGFGIEISPVVPRIARAILALTMWWFGFCHLAVETLFWITLFTTIVVTLVGVWTSNVMEKYWGESPRAFVIDVFIGVWILALLGLFLFRIIDIYKPLDCRWIDQNVKGARRGC